MNKKLRKKLEDIAKKGVTDWSDEDLIKLSEEVRNAKICIPKKFRLKTPKV